MNTIKEVALKAKVSVATVSRVINDDPAVKPETREMVQKVIREMEYQPNILGRHLRKARTKKILVLVPSVSNQFYSKIITQIEKTARTEGYRVMIGMSHSDKDTERDYIEMLETKSIDGIIFLSSKLTAIEMTALASKNAVVQCCEFIEGSSSDIVSIDNEKASYDAVSYLIDQGHKSIAFFGSKERYFSGNLRENGYKKALVNNGLKIAKGNLFYDDYSYTSGERMARDMRKLDKAPTAVFCISDSIAIGCIKELVDSGIKVPEEVSVMGFDDTSIAKMYMPTISTVAQPQSGFGRIAAEYLIKRIEGDTSPFVFRLLPHELVLRQTTISKI